MVSWWDALRFCNALSQREGLTPAYHLTGSGPPPASGTGPSPGGPIERNRPMPAPDGLLPGGDVRPRDGEPGVIWDRDADGYRLPTEAEWEHACRAGTGGPRYGPLDDIAWHRGNSGERPHDVGTRQANPWGLHDMLGNVWEWCWDVYDAEVYGTYRVLRGGGWFDEHWSCRASVRRRSHPTLRLDDVGFRLARTPRALRSR
jgi:sulfatase modifying factor 1